MNLKKLISEIDINADAIADPILRANFIKMQNALESYKDLTAKQKKEIQKLLNEINRLKGEQGKPNIRKQTKNGQNKSKDISSEKERKQTTNSKKNCKGKKNHKVKINRTEICKFDKSTLPPDAVFKGHLPVIVQELVIRTDNIEFLKEKYYSPSLRKTFIASLPQGYEGEFGPNLRSLIISLYHDSYMTEPKIASFLKTHHILVSDSSISRILTKKLDYFHVEKKDIVGAGLSSSEYHQMDDTGARVNGKNYFTHILCNPCFTAYFTRQHKDRLTILEFLSQDNLMFAFDESAYMLMAKMKLPNKVLKNLRDCKAEKEMTRNELDELLKKLFPKELKHKKNRRIILEAAAITFYKKLANAVLILLVDDAPQFKQITENLALCWIHDGRHYKKLDPVINSHRKQLNLFLKKYWDYYHKLLDYKKSPAADAAKKLSNEFDELFSSTTGYVQLDERIKRTKLKKELLLLVLKHPNLPLHNNNSELGARAQARRRDISFQTKNDDGTDAKDTFMTIIETSKKLDVNVFDYILDRVSKKFEMPSLASLIRERTKQPMIILYDTS